MTNYMKTGGDIKGDMERRGSRGIKTPMIQMGEIWRENFGKR